MVKANAGENVIEIILSITGPSGAVAKSLANGLVGTRFISQYQFFKSTMGRCKATAPSSLSLTSNRVTANY